MKLILLVIHKYSTTQTKRLISKILETKLYNIIHIKLKALETNWSMNYSEFEFNSNIQQDKKLSGSYIRRESNEKIE